TAATVGQAKSPDALVKSDAAKSAAAATGTRPQQRIAPSANASDAFVFSCDAHATASTLAGWTRKKSPPPSAAWKPRPARRNHALQSSAHRAWIATLTRW